MSLIVTPVQSMTAYCIQGNSFYMTREFGELWFWVYQKTPVHYGDADFSSTYRGFRRTTRSPFLERDHNCEHLQLSGDVVDGSFLSGISSKPVANPYPGYAGVPCVTYLRNTLGGVVYDTPAPIMVEAGTTSITKFTSAGVYAELWSIVISKSLSLFGYVGNPTYGVPIRPDYIGKSTDNLWFYAYNVSAWKNKAQVSTLTIPMVGRTYSLETMQNYVIPLCTQYFMTAWWNPYEWVNYRTFSSSATLPDLSTLAAISASREDGLVDAVDVLMRQSPSHGELHYEALSKVDGFTGNGFAYLKDVKNIISELKDLYALLKGNVTPKSLSSVYLTWRYGLRLTAADTKELTTALSQMAKSASGYSATKYVTVGALQTKVTSTIRCTRHDSAFEDLYFFFRYLDLLPSAENIWDLIPFSFVLDWFANIGGVADRLDKIDLISHLNIRAVYDSYKTTYVGPASFINPYFLGTVTVTRYSRKCHLDASFPLIVSNSRGSVTRWVDGLALIIQRLK